MRGEPEKDGGSQTVNTHAGGAHSFPIHEKQDSTLNLFYTDMRKAIVGNKAEVLQVQPLAPYSQTAEILQLPSIPALLLFALSASYYIHFIMGGWGLPCHIW